MDRDRLARLPKALLHDHLDGGVRVETVLELAGEAGYEGLPFTEAGALRSWFDQGDSGSLEDYLAAFTHTVAVMQTADALERVAYEAVVDLAADDVVYAELRFGPSLHTEQGLTLEEVVDAVAGGIRLGEQETGAVVGLILSALRDEKNSEQIADLAVTRRDRGVVGFDLAGPERGDAADAHLEACRRAREANLALTIHAGEGDGPTSIWRALHRCGASRLGHGVRIVEDLTFVEGDVDKLGALATYIRDRQVPLELCITSNIGTGIVGSAAAHPIGALYRAGFTVTLNTDNRLMSNTTLTDEFGLAARFHGFGPAEFQAVTENALAAAFADLPTRRRILDERVRPVYRDLV